MNRPSVSRQALDRALEWAPASEGAGELPVILDPEVFGKCNFKALTDERFDEGLWSLSRGGHPVPDDVWCIDLYNEEGDALVRWQLPAVFALLFELRRKEGDRQRLNQVRQALQI